MWPWRRWLAWKARVESRPACLTPHPSLPLHRTPKHTILAHRTTPGDYFSLRPPRPGQASQQCLGADSQLAQRSDSHSLEVQPFPAAIPDRATSAPISRARSISVVMGGATRGGRANCAAPAAAGCAEEVQRRSWRGGAVAVRAGLFRGLGCEDAGGNLCEYEYAGVKARDTVRRVGDGIGWRA